MSDACCSPGAGRPPVPGSGTPALAPVGAAAPRSHRWVTIEAGPFLMGNEDAHAIPGDGEGPVREVDVAGFAIDACATTVSAFAEFVRATGHRTTAERAGWSFVFVGLLPEGFPPTRAVAAAPWWREVHGADWAHPEGPGSDVAGRGGHPVVHVSRDDAEAYCRWAGLRLPTEPEWEKAARGGILGARFPWGDELEPGGEHRMNVWQGDFPRSNTLGDGWYGTCPVDAFPANGLGLHNVVGNVWEWTADPWSAEGLDGLHAMRGGSYLCHASYCERYRVAARSANPADASTGNLGFRCVQDDPPA